MQDQLMGAIFLRMLDLTYLILANPEDLNQGQPLSQT